MCQGSDNRRTGTGLTGRVKKNNPRIYTYNIYDTYSTPGRNAGVFCGMAEREGVHRAVTNEWIIKKLTCRKRVSFLWIKLEGITD